MASDMNERRDERESIDDILRDAQLSASVGAELTKQESDYLVRLMDRREADLRQQLAEARAEQDKFKSAWIPLNKEFIALGANYRINLEKLAAQSAELATLRERLAAAEKENDAIITQALADAGIDMEPGYARLREMIAAAKKRHATQGAEQ